MNATYINPELPKFRTNENLHGHFEEISSIKIIQMFNVFSGLTYSQIGLINKKQVRGTTRCVTISMKYYALTGLERFDWYAHVWMSWEF